MVPGWRDVRVRFVEGRRVVESDPYMDTGEVEWSGAESLDGTVHCAPECGWEGGRAELVQLDREGTPLTNVSREQLQLCLQ